MKLGEGPELTFADDEKRTGKGQRKAPFHSRREMAAAHPEPEQQHPDWRGGIDEPDLDSQTLIGASEQQIGKQADADGRYSWNLVTNSLPDRIVAVDEETGEFRDVRFNLQRSGQRLTVDIVLLAQGTYNETLTTDKALTILGANHGVSGTAARGAESESATGGKRRR